MERALPNASFVAARCESSTVSLAKGYDAVCAFVDDDLGSSVVDALADADVTLILLRCAGYDNVDVERARERGVSVMRVPAYDPLAISEHAVGMMLSLNRHLCASRDSACGELYARRARRQVPARKDGGRRRDGENRSRIRKDMR